ncbi:hypothetical protein L226DRAFT_151131 [Lentinus tigrinus ALCF2SS1-7]|uniref:Uncharacterized protein n=1 Tax=Lentinus tigrinus ALCF2SS1-6 TaxID=1328759 RepID=A0A5C2RPJ5_9APHY|nr:hypothetical protein L227DRAFT_398721 [Lentinus tigrinus ALCF2SS1-6]RPD72654.1 hypothetical protein L226DRAFT_151131 [Lentinus tigrinus ALCF2SS1-7]
MDPYPGPSVQDVATCSNITQAALANLSQAVDIALQQVELAFVYELSYLRENTINLALSTTFFGLSTVLAVVAAYVLFSKNIKRRATALMLAAIVIMWASTTAYWLVTLAVAAKIFSKLPDLTSQILGGVADMQACMTSSWRSDTGAFGDSECPLDIPDVPVFLHEASWTQDLANTASTTVSVVIGDAIVWWRAWVLWPDSRLVHLVCILMLLLTVTSGVVDIILPAHSAAPTTRVDLGPITYDDSTQFLLSGDVWAIVVCCVSLLTNVIATALISYRAWQHRRNIMSYLKESSPNTQVERTLALLVESGLLYCGLWIVVTIYGATDIFPNPRLIGFAKGFTYVMRGCLVPLIGMYPTLIIIICAVDKSLYEKSVYDAPGQLGSVRFNVSLTTRRRRGTLSELISTTSTFPVQDISGGASDAVEDIGPRIDPTGTIEARQAGSGPLQVDKANIVPSSPPSPCGLG